MKILVTCLLIVGCVFLGYSQKILTDASLEQNLDLFQLNEPLDLWLNFLNSENDSEGAQYWNQKEVDFFGETDYFQLKDLDYFDVGDKIKTLHYGLTIRSITYSDSVYKIMSQLTFEYNDNVTTTPFIFHVYAKIEDVSGELKLYNPFPINKEIYTRSEKVGNITYVFLKNHNFNKKLARKQSKLLRKVSKEFNLDLGTYTFFFTDSRESYFKMRGYDFHFENIGPEFPSGKADLDNNEVYSYGCNEYYPHELLHLLINSKFKNAHLWFNEGFVTYFGYSRGKPLNWHIDKLKLYVNSHSEFTFSNLLELRSLDDMTDFRYVVGGLFVKLAYEKGGAELVIQLLNSGKSDIDFYKTLSLVFGVGKEEVNTFLMKELKN